jgi:asparagine synthase (glutamine-hydrolysing)
MCGIAGIVGVERDRRVEPIDLQRMCDTIVYRGPDDEGFYVQGHVGLGMRRLSIIDLASGHQPIHNEDQTIWTVFNGEIYNFSELRSELEIRGHRFYTNTDTEVIVHLYEDFGSDCIRKLRGMFAIALWDDRNQRLLLARDRFGKKPLYYSLHKGRLLFGSEIKTLFAVAPELAEIAPQGVLDFFYFGYIPDPHTSFADIKKLSPGHLLEFVGGQVRVRKYWDLPEFGVHVPRSEEECLEELEHRLSEAVRIRLISDVPLGALLSGGVDSSTVVALMSRASSKPVKTFSIGFAKQDFNELEYARLVAQKFGTDHHELVLRPNFEETLDNLTHSLEEPFADSSMLPTYFVSKMAREQVTVALAGDAGDELFAGYDRYQTALSRRIFDGIPKSLGRLYRTYIYPRLPHTVRGRKFAYNITLPWRERYLDAISFLPALDRETSLFSDGFRRVAVGCQNPFEIFREYFERAPATDALSQLLYLDAKTYLTGDILTKVDRMSMLCSLEVRAPFLDHVFAEWVTGLPSHWKLRGSTQKYILKKLAERLGVPREVLYRPKKGFALPLVHWMRHELKEELTQLLLEPRTLQRGYFDPRAIRNLLHEHFQGQRDRSSMLWGLLIFEMWHRNFLEVPRAREISSSPIRSLDVSSLSTIRGGVSSPSFAIAKGTSQ